MRVAAPGEKIVDTLRHAINPKAVERHRDRFRVAGAKSDLRDAGVLATLLRTDRAQYRP